MTLQQISKVWTVVSLFFLYYALNTFIVSQGGNEIFGAKLIVAHRIPAAMMGIPICSVLLLVTSLIGAIYACRTGPGWYSRIPIVGFDSIETGSREGKVYQGAMFGLLAILPALSLIHFWRLFDDARLVTTKNPPQPIVSIWSWSGLTSLNDPARICTHFNVISHDNAPTTYSCEGNITILPGLEPTLFAVLTAAAILAMGFHAWTIFFRASDEQAL